MSTTELPALSPETVASLKELREHDNPAFLSYVKALRASQWPLRAISDPLGVSRTTVSNWEAAAPSTADLPEVEVLPLAAPKERTKATKKVELTEAEIEELHRLTVEASNVRRFTDANSQSRQSARLLESMLYNYREKGHTLTQLAKACQVSRSAIAQRLRKIENG
ncbi:helix-turn-helix DNA binding domain [Arthrobacter phage Atuin]|nr:helix-turn-helix DNA binding domain protein [Arthrobacter phage Atuin]